MTRLITCVLGALAIGGTLVIAGAVGAEPSAPTDRSMQPHLKAWSNIIRDSSKRFVVLPDFDNAAVLDRETGLVWEQAPDFAVRAWSSPTPPFGLAADACISKSIGSRTGWRLPSIHELMSVVDRTLGGLSLPPGHPFTNVQGVLYWSATTVAMNPAFAWVVDFNGGGATPNVKSTAYRVWCVRGGGPISEY
jgi:uncharacterized protein DUF1566